MNKGLDWPMALTIKISPKNSDLIYIGAPRGGNYKLDFSDDAEQESPTSESGGSSGGGSFSVWFLLIIIGVYFSFLTLPLLRDL